MSPMSMAACGIRSALVWLVLALAAHAQSIIQGTNGPDFLQGTQGQDVVWNCAGPPPLRSDAQKDMVDVSGDPGNADRVLVGPEDRVRCDDDDCIVVLDPAGNVVWSGSGKEYKEAQLNLLAIFSWIRFFRDLYNYVFSFFEVMLEVLPSFGIDPFHEDNEWIVLTLLAWDYFGPPEEPPPIG